MAQPTGQSGGKNPLGITSFWPSTFAEPPMLWEFWFNRFQWGMVAKYSINPKNFYYASTFTAAQVTDLPVEVDGKDRLASEQTLISNLYLCLGEKGQDELHKKKPHLNLSTTRYSRVLDNIGTEFKKERNETYETFQLLARKQQIGELLEQFHSVDDQGTNFMSKEVRAFCHEQGIEILISPVNDHRATRCVERTIDSIKNSVLTYVREDKPEPLDRMVERALGALRFVKNATLNITPFEAHHGREANTVLRKLTKKPTLRNLNWENVIRSKSACLDERDPIAQAIPEPMDTNWGIRSDTEYDLKNRRKPLKLADDQATNQDDEPGIVRAPSDPVEIPPAVVMQRTGERNLNRYGPLNSDIVNQSKHTIEMSNGAVLRKSGVALKKAKVPKKRAPGQIAAPPTPGT